MNAVAAALIAGTLFFTTVAHADEAPLSTEGDREASPWTAVGLSAGVTALGYGAFAVAEAASGGSTSRQVVALSGLSLGLLGPATGHLWTSDFDRAALFTGGRLLLVGTAAFAISALVADGDGPDSGSHHPHPYVDGALAIGSLAGVVALSVWETVDAYQRAAARIERARAAAPSFTVGPFLAPPLTGAARPATTVAGLQAFARF